MSQAHLIDHLETAKKLAELSGRPFLAYLIKIAKEEAIRAERARPPRLSPNANSRPGQPSSPSVVAKPSPA